MNVVLSWLREFCPTEASADEVAEALTAVGVKVEDIARPWAGLDGVVIAKVLTVEDHPDSNKLCVVRVDTGAGEHTVCAGVRNMQPGDLVPYAKPGSRVPVIPEPLGIKTLRGVPSEGMLCSPRELHIADLHTGILILPSDAPFGGDMKSWAGLEDAVLDIEIEPNRPDLMSVRGVAREASAVLGVPFFDVVPTVIEGDEEASAKATVEIWDLERCSNYRARVISGMRVGTSPVAVQARLTAAGMRPISDVVDATNYVLLECGHPLHPFDLARLDGNSIVVRRANEGESLVTLDEVERELTGEDLVIADRTKGVAIAGIMGSTAAEVGPNTSTVLLEAAYFQPVGVLRTARRLGLATEASMRFERGADPEAVEWAADRAASLIAAWTGGTVLQGSVSAGAVPVRRSVSLRPERAEAVLGMGSIPRDVMSSKLASVGLIATTTDISGDPANTALVVEVPGFRIDIQREEDLVEEIARVGRGYESVPAVLPIVRGSGGMPAPYAFRRRAKQLLAEMGFFEVRSSSFASVDDLALMGDPVEKAIKVANSLVADEGYLRMRLTPALLRSLQRNQSRHVGSVRLFESGVVFRAGAPVDEVHKVAFALTGAPEPSWTETQRSFDVFDATGALTRFLDGLHVRHWRLGDPAPMPFHPGRSASIIVNGAHAGVVGELHPRVCATYDLGRAAIAVMSLESLRAAASSDVAVVDVPRFPPSLRDLAFVVPADVPAEALREAMHAAGGDLVGSVVLFDVFRGTPVLEGWVSLAFAVEIRAADRTLTVEETDGVVIAIADALHTEFGAEQRGGAPGA